MTTPTQRLISRDARARQETRRGTVLSDPGLVDFDPAGQASAVWVVRVDIGAGKPIDDVIVKSQTGNGGRAYAKNGAAVIIQKGSGGRWYCIGPSDRKRSTGSLNFLDESDDSTSAGVGTGLTSARKKYDFYQGDLPATPGSGRYGSKGYGNTQIFDANGDEVI